MINKTSKGFDKLYKKVVAETMRNQRIKERYTAAALSKELGYKPNTFFYYENGERDIPMSLILDFCSFFHLDYKEFIERAVDRVKNETEESASLGE